MIDQILEFARSHLDEKGEQLMSALSLQLAGTYDIWSPYALPLSFAVLMAALTGFVVILHVISKVVR